MDMLVYKSLEDAKEIILEFEKNNGVNIFFIFQWMTNWLEYFNNGYEVEVVSFFVNNELIGFIPLCFIKNRIFNNIEYHIIGEGKSSYLHLPIIEQYKEVVYDKLIAYLKETGKNFNITFSDISSNSKDYDILNNLMKQYNGNRNELYCCPFANLNCDWNEFFLRHHENPEKKRKIRSLYRRLQKIGDISFIRINTPELLEKYYSYFLQTFEVHKLRFQNVINSSHYSDVRFKDFYINIIKDFSKLGILELSILCLDGDPISFILTFKQDNIIIDYLPAFDPAFSKYSLGHIHLMLLFEQLCNEGNISIFDFSKGDGEYKRRWSDDAYNNYSFTFNVYKSKIFNMNLYIKQLILKLKLFSRSQGWNIRIKKFLGRLKNINNNFRKIEIVSSSISDTEKGLLEFKEFNYLLVKGLDGEERKFIFEMLYHGDKVKLGYKQDKLLYIIKEDKEPKYYRIKYN
jgi:CelD/BcsL family acetyltransferase involved in cellulose biosynthesis